MDLVQRSFVFLCFVITLCSALEIALVTKLGKIVGTNRTIEGENVERFLGIPYAKPPVGELRFAKPEPYGDFPNGNLNATAFGPECAQLDSGNNTGSEDCLYLNVFTPAAATIRNKKSVLIWIHGGSFTMGSSNAYPADILVAVQDVVVVTINYRLNIFGFLTTGSSTLPGNYGLWDQKLAIQWVKDNIDEYGGDPSSITLFGESAGGRSISFQLFSPTNNVNLFQRAITESGTALSLTYINRDPTPVTINVSRSLSCELDDQILECLRTKSLDELLDATKHTDRPFPFFPIVDNDFLKHDLGRMMANFTMDNDSPNVREMIGNFASYDLFSGWNDQDGLMYMRRIYDVNRRMTGKDLSDGISAEVLATALTEYPFYRYGGGAFETRVTVNTFINFYMNSPQPLISDSRTKNDRRLEIYSNIAGDVALKLPTVQLLQLHSIVSNRNTFGYEFSHKRTAKGLWYEGPDWLRTGADHADEIAYVLGAPLLSPLYTEDERELSRRMMRHWANFARTGNPGNDYISFNYPHNQTYTLLKTGDFEKLSYPLDDVQRLWSAVDAAFLESMEDSASASNNHCQKTAGSHSYLSGILTLTGEEVDQVMTGILVVAVLLAVLSVILTISLVSAKWQAARNKKK